jgi:hypothetical protein
MADRQVEAYRTHAGVCLWLAQRTSDPETKLILLDMARAWQALAEQGEKNRNTTLVYETPEPRLHTAQQQPKPGRSDPEIRQ